MVKRNENIAKLQSGYLFPEINRRKKAVMEKSPNAEIISLGIGNTTEPLTPHVTTGLVEAAVGLGTTEGYSGYGDEQGLTALRERISQVFYQGRIKPSEVFVSDGAKCDCGRLQLLFGSKVSIAVQDPAYPVYVDGSVIAGASGDFNQEKALFNGIEYMPCNPDNGFFPEFSKVPKTDLIYFCSPNNPTGAVATKDQLKTLIEFASRNNSILVFDAAYSEYIRDKSLPRSIFEIEGTERVAIEVNSFSKPLGFTGVRLGWTVVPEALKFDDGASVNRDWNRVVSTIFNGASNIVQRGALKALDETGLSEMRQTVDYYMANAQFIKNFLEARGLKTYGGNDAPYVWCAFPGRKSWDVFTEILEKAHVVTTPGVGFGPAGEGFIRFSAFGHRKNVERACQRLKELDF